MKTNWEAIIVMALLAVGVIAFQGNWAAGCGEWVNSRVLDLRDWSIDHFGRDSIFSQAFMLRGILGVVLVSLICGAYSSLVVSNKMAFFSDALAHCAFAGIAVGYILFFLGQLAKPDDVIAVMILFGMVVGVAIAYVRDKTLLANDTVIGVFFAAAMGLGAILLKPMGQFGMRVSPENFLFGDILSVDGRDVIYLAALAGLTLYFLWRQYNPIVFASFNPSLARSRRVEVKYGNYLFIVLLAVVVNVCLHVVGVLLINALLILPGATAANLSRNLRQFFWLSCGLSIVAGFAGLMIAYSWEPVLGGREMHFPVGGMIVEIGALLFFASILVGRWVRGRRAVMPTTW
jgi:zinc transport system permease protein